MNADLTYTITVTNNGPATATSVIVTDTLPANVTFVSVASSQGTSTYVGGTVSCVLGSLTSNAIAIVQIVVIPTEAGLIANTATVSADQSDPNQANNTAAVTTTVLAPARLNVNPANYDFGTVTIGTTASATFVVTNTGGAMLTGTATVSGDPFAVVSGNSFSVPGFGSANVVVSFTPPSPVDFNGDVVFGSNGGSFTNSLTGIGATNAPPPDTTPPTLIVSSPTNYQLFTNAAITVTGVASDASGIRSVTVNGVDASILGSNWSAAFTQDSGTNTITVIATDDSANMNTATQVVYAVLNTMVPTIHSPQITAGLSVTNALLLVGSTAVVLVDDTNAFSVTATASDSLEYQWVFGDGDRTNTMVGMVEHVYTNECGPYNASVIVSDGRTSTNSDLIAAVACQMQIIRLRANLNFARFQADSCAVRVTFNLPADYSFAGKLATLDIGGAQGSFTLPKKCSAFNGSSTFSKPHYNKKTGLWTIKATLKNGSWQDAWDGQGMVDATIRSPGIPVQLRVILLIDNEAFAADKSLNYRAKAGKSGTAR